jgi:hypothetical protein
VRIRTVKPEFYQHEKIGQLPRELRLLAIGLLNWSDDEGYFRTHPALIAGAVFPFDEDGQPFVSRGVVELERIGFIELFEEGVGRIASFADHQVINKPSKSRLRAKALTPHTPVVLPEDSRSTPVALPYGARSRELGAGSLEVEKESPSIASQSGVLEPPKTPRKMPAEGSWQALIDALTTAFAEAREGTTYDWSDVALAQLKRLRKKHSDSEILTRWRRGLRGTYQREVNSIAQLSSDAKWNALATDEPTKPTDLKRPMQPSIFTESANITGSF